MGLQDHVQEANRAYTIQTSIWPKCSSAIRISGTQFARSINYTHDITRRTTKATKPVDDHGGRSTLRRITPTSLEIKGQILA
jgi:hypothetical protein